MTLPDVADAETPTIPPVLPPEIRSATPALTKRSLGKLLFLGFILYCFLPFVLFFFTPMGTSVTSLLSFAHLPGRTPAEPGFVQVAAPPQAEDAPDFTPTPTTLLPAVPETEQRPPIEDKVISVLLLGYGGPGHDGPYLTDSMVLALINPQRQTLVLLGLPRDIWVKLPLGQSEPVWSKLNTAYTYGVDNTVYKNKPSRYRGPLGGGHLSKDTVGDVLGLDIQHFIALDFEGFRKMIDAAGGIQVTVPASFTATYPTNDNSSIDDSWTLVHFQAGKQQMNGQRALEFARAREVFDNPSESNDFARTRRQHIIMQAFKDRAVSFGNLPRLPAVLNVFRQYVTTDLALPSLAELDALLQVGRNAKVFSTSLTPMNYLEESSTSEGAYVLVPANSNWTQVHGWVRELVRQPALADEMAKTEVLVQNASGERTIGNKMAERLVRAGLRVAGVVQTVTQPLSVVEDRTADDNKRVAQYVRDLLMDEFSGLHMTLLARDSASPRVIVTLGRDRRNEESIATVQAPLP